MDGNGLFALLIQKDAADPGLIRRALDQPAAAVVTLQCVDGLRTALARIGGGGVDLILLDLSLRDEQSTDGLSGLLQLRKVAPQADVVVLYDASDEGLALRALRAGATAAAPKPAIGPASGEDIAQVIRSAADRRRKPAVARTAAPPRPTGAVVAFLGAKGGVGTTTVALSVAAALAGQHQVILVEMRPAFGTLRPSLAAREPERNLSDLVHGKAEITAEQVVSCLWACKKVPGLRVLFGPQKAAECAALPPGRVQELVAVLAGSADFVVLDLPSSLSEANRAAVRASNRVVLVMERDPFCVELARRMTETVEGWEGTPQPIEAMVVNRTLLSCPMPLAEIERLLGFAPLAVVPPAPELCLAAQRGHVPLVALQPESLVADSLLALASKCQRFQQRVPMVVGRFRGVIVNPMESHRAKAAQQFCRINRC